MAEKEKRQKILDGLKKEGVMFLLVQFVDINGSPKVKQIPIDCFNDAVDDGAGFAGAAVQGLGQGPESHDLMAKIDLDTVVQLPWKPNVAVANSNLSWMENRGPTVLERIWFE